MPYGLNDSRTGHQYEPGVSVSAVAADGQLRALRGTRLRKYPQIEEMGTVHALDMARTESGIIYRLYATRTDRITGMRTNIYGRYNANDIVAILFWS